MLRVNILLVACAAIALASPRLAVDAPDDGLRRFPSEKYGFVLDVPNG